MRSPWGELAVGGEFVDNAGEYVGELGGGGFRGDAEFACELAEHVATEDVLELVRGDGQILAVADAGSGEVAKAMLLETGKQSGEAAGLVVHYFQNGGEH